MTLTEDVCERCNSKVFSPLDTHLLRFARDLVYWDHPAAGPKKTTIQGRGLALDEQAGVWVSIRVDGTGKPAMFPQYVFMPGGAVGVFLDPSEGVDWTAMAAQMQQELSKPTALSLSRQIVPDSLGEGLPALQTAVVRTARNTYVIRSANEKSADALEAAIREGRSLTSGTLSDPRYTEQTGVVAHHQWDFNVGAMERALSKTALNFVCASVGPDVARTAAFDAIRSFAITPYDESNSGFVHWLFAQGMDDQIRSMFERFTRKGYHTLVLTKIEHVPFLAVVLYERPFAFVRLTSGPARGALPPDTMIVGLFDYKSKTHKIVKMADDPISFARQFSFV
jgi:hypothetical protein